MKTEAFFLHLELILIVLIYVVHAEQLNPVQGIEYGKEIFFRQSCARKPLTTALMATTYTDTEVHIEITGKMVVSEILSTSRQQVETRKRLNVEEIKCTKKEKSDYVSEIENSKEREGKEETVKKDNSRDVVLDNISDYKEKAEEKLKTFGYHFNEKGQLRDIKTGGPYVFEVIPGDKEYNQRRYTEIGQVINEYVYGLLETDGGLKRVSIPVDAQPEESKGFFFMSKDAETNPNRLVLIIHGTGVVRAGQWARRIIINDCLDKGIQLPYVKRALAQGFGVIVTNTNLNKAEDIDGTMKPIRGSESAENHILYVWDRFVRNSKAKEVAIVAHSYGGVATLNLIQKRFSDVESRIKAIALTDSVHGYHNVGENLRASWMKERTCNWMGSNEPLDTPLGKPLGKTSECDLVSAGTDIHEYTSHEAFESVFSFLASKLSPLSP